MDNIKEFISRYFGAIIGVIVAILVLLTNVYKLFIAIILILVIAGIIIYKHLNKEVDGINGIPVIVTTNGLFLKYEGTRNKAIGYDLNSSYSNAMLKPIPDTSVPYHSGTVKAGEIGFKEDENGHLVPVFENNFSYFIFSLMDILVSYSHTFCKAK